MSKVCNPPKVLNPRTGRFVSANYLKQLNKKQGLPSLLPIPKLPLPPSICIALQFSEPPLFTKILGVPLPR